jgi:outer membrane protein, heavy metal efflux system
VKLSDAIFPLVALGLGACATPRPTLPAESPETIVAKFSARSFQDAGLQAFLVENLGRAPETWDYEALSWVAFYYHPSLEIARAQWAASRAAQRTMGERPNPIITLSPGFNPSHDVGVSPWFPAINLDFLLPTSDKRAHQQEIARAEAEAARFAVLATVWQVRIALRAALSDADNADRRLLALRTQAELQQGVLALLEQRVAAGSGVAADVAVARIAALRAEAAAAEVGSQSLAARTRTAMALGLPVGALSGINLPVAPPSAQFAASALAAARHQSLKSRSDVLVALAKLRAREAGLALETAKQQPDFHLGPGYQWDQGASKWNVALTFELPIFHRNEGPIGEAVARRDEAAAQLIAVQALAVSGIETAVAARASAGTALDHARRAHAEIEKQNAMVAQRIALGAADRLEVLTARLDLAMAAAALTEAEAAVGVADGQIEDALQIPFPRLAALADAARVRPTRIP